MNCLPTMIQDPLAIVAVLFAVICFSLFMVNRFKWAERLSPILWILFVGALCSNVGLIPTNAPIYGQLIDVSVPFAVCVILLSVNLKDVKKAGAPMLVAFVLAMIGTVLGVAIASLTLEPALVTIMGDETWKLAGPYTGTYIGGSLNFFSLWTGLEIENPDLLAAANAVDNITIFPLYMFWMIIPATLAERYVVAKRWKTSGAEAAGPVIEKEGPFKVLNIALLIFLGFTIMALSNWVKEALLDPILPGLPSILIVTTFALILAQIPAIRKITGGWELGDLVFYVFFAAVGAIMDFYLAVILSPILFAYVVIVMLVHLVFVYGIGWLAKMDLGVLTIASVATKSGPALVPPVAETKEWRHLILPGILIALLGYAVGNYVGFAVAKVLQVILG